MSASAAVQIAIRSEVRVAATEKDVNGSIGAIASRRNLASRNCG